MDLIMWSRRWNSMRMQGLANKKRRKVIMTM